MQSLPPALAGLAAFRQFMLWTLVPSKNPRKAALGKMDKVPVSPHTFTTANAHDPAQWVDAATACMLATQAGPTYGVAFVFTPTDPFFFIDLDSAYDPATGQWSAHAQYVCSLFPGAAVEVSQSGRGLHIFGRTAPLTHGCKDEAHGAELYTQYRFAALTGINATGDVNTDHSFLLQQFAAHFFPYVEGQDANGDFTLSTGPVPEWRGPTDDADLLRRALMSKSVAAAFGARASFKDLWEGNADVLSVTYPDPDRRWNESTADAALVGHLGFWTGRHGERIAKLLWQSGLKRDKWDRPDYIPRTITEVLARDGAKYTVLQDEPPATGPVASELVNDDSPLMRAVTGNTFLDGAGTRDIFKGCVYVKDRGRVLVPGSGLMNKDQLNVLYGGYTFALDDINQRTTRKAWEAFTENGLLRPPIADRTCFRPELPPLSLVQDAGKVRVNTYEPAATPRLKGDASPFWAHLAKLFPDERDRCIFWSYMCALVQHKGVKFAWCPVLQGMEGNGKTLFSSVVAHAVGSHYTFWPDAQEMANKFNAWLSGRIFIAVEELRHPQLDMRELITEKLKTMIAGGLGLSIEAKGVDQIVDEICANFMVTTNHHDAVRKTADNMRRCAIFFSPQQHHGDLERWGMSGDYFPKLYNWLKFQDGFAIVAEELHTYAIPPEFNPANGMHRAPDTSSTAAAITHSRGAVEQQVIETVEQGVPGFMGGWISSYMLGLLLDNLRQGQRINLVKRKEMMRALGYELHPALPDGRVNNAVLPDGRKTQLFIRTGHPDMALTSPADVAKAYTAAQTVK